MTEAGPEHTRAKTVSPAAGLKCDTTAIEGLWLVHLKEVGDERGVVREFFRSSAFEEAGMDPIRPWRQVNVTESGQGVVRGLHGEDMTKLVLVVWGEAFGAYVDTRAGSSSYGTVVTAVLTPDVAVFVPRGVCNGFQATASGQTQYLYCFDAEWEPGMSGVAVSAFDPDLAIPWPLAVDLSDRSQVSEKDASLPHLSELHS